MGSVGGVNGECRGVHPKTCYTQSPNECSWSQNINICLSRSNFYTRMTKTFLT